MMAAQWIVKLASVYGVAGAAVAAAFVLAGIDRIDPAAERSYPFRILLIPGLVLLWPLVVVIWMRRAAAGKGH